MIIARTKFDVNDLIDIPFSSKGMAKLKGGTMWFFYNDVDSCRVTVNMDTGEVILGKSDVVKS